MRSDSPIQQLHSIRRSFGRASARRKERLLIKIANLERIPARDLVVLQSTLDFVRAYPDNQRILEGCRDVVARLRPHVQHVSGGCDSTVLWNTGFPGAVNTHEYSYATLCSLVRRNPSGFEIDWDQWEDDGRLASMLEMLLSAIENEAMEYVSLEWHEWTAQVRPRSCSRDLLFLLGLFERSCFSPPERACLFDSLGLPIRYVLDEVGTGRCEVELPVDEVHYQSHNIPRESFPLEPEIRKPLPVQGPVGLGLGRQILDFALRALCSRNLEIHALMYGNPGDVVLLSAERGIQVALAGVVPEHRNALSGSYSFLVLKNGVPIAYGPASPFLGSCEMGINLFPEFRGSEIRYICSQLMRLLHHALGVDYFYLTRYGMGEDNEDAIGSGAFWFYRRLGFHVSAPEVEVLARAEEERMRADPRHRSSTRMLHRLSQTEAYYDLSEGKCVRFPFGRLGLAVARFVAEEFDGDRVLAARSCTSRVLRALNIDSVSRWSKDELRAFRNVAPALAMIPDIESWPERDKSEMKRIIRAKGGQSEAPAGIRMARHRRFRNAILRLAE